jgi:dihydrofolate reductase
MIVFKLIAAVCSDGGIGYKGGLPWPHCKADMAHFAKRTTGAGNNAVVMGKKTWDSIPARPLRRRANLILSSQAPEQMHSEQSDQSEAPAFTSSFWLCTQPAKSTLMKCALPRWKACTAATRFSH